MKDLIPCIVKALVVNLVPEQSTFATSVKDARNKRPIFIIQEENRSYSGF